MTRVIQWFLVHPLCRGVHSLIKENVGAPSDLSITQQFPPLPNFSASSEDSFQNWIGQFELVAEIYKWSKQAKVMNLITHVRGEAFQFFLLVL